MRLLEKGKQGRHHHHVAGSTSCKASLLLLLSMIDDDSASWSAGKDELEHGARKHKLVRGSDIQTRSFSHLGAILQHRDRDDNGAGDEDDEEEEEQLRLQFVREVRFLREQLAAEEATNDWLQSKIAALTEGLEQTTEELERRMTLFSDATERVASLERQISEAKKTLLTKEMQLHGLTQENNTMRKVMEGKDKERLHWEQEFLRVNDQSSDSSRLNDKLNEANDELKQDIKTWKSKKDPTSQLNSVS